MVANTLAIFLSDGDNMLKTTTAEELLEINIMNGKQGAVSPFKRPHAILCDRTLWKAHQFWK